MTEISPEPLPARHIEVQGHRMAYVSLGEGRPIVFQHGNPTSSYVWRNIMPYAAQHGRAIAVDLIGMGGSDKLSSSGPDRYRFHEHADFLYAAWDALGVTQDVVLVLHDWGTALGFHWARQNPEKVRGLVHMEGFVRPMTAAEWPDAIRPIFQSFRGEQGEDMVLNRNLFVEAVLPNGVLRGLTETEMAQYRAPYLEPGEGRRPTLTWPREIPFDGEPADVHKVVEDFSAWLAESEVPKLFFNADPGVVLTGPMRAFCRTFKNQEEVTISGLHFVQEDSPHQIGEALLDWLDRLP